MEIPQDLIENENQNLAQDSYVYQLKIPEDRVAVLIGTEGKIKALIEKETDSKLDISKEGDVNIEGSDGMRLFTCREIIRAIGRGFNPKIALELVKTDYVLEIISLRDVVGKSQKSMERLKGRIIGRGGKSRKIIEDFTGCSISVYGKTIGILGPAEDVALAHQAVSMLLSGAMHKTVFKYLEKKKKEVKFGITDEMVKKYNEKE